MKIYESFKLFILKRFTFYKERIPNQNSLFQSQLPPQLMFPSLRKTFLLKFIWPLHILSLISSLDQIKLILFQQINLGCFNLNEQTLHVWIGIRINSLEDTFEALIYLNLVDRIYVNSDMRFRTLRLNNIAPTVIQVFSPQKSLRIKYNLVTQFNKHGEPLFWDRGEGDE